MILAVGPLTALPPMMGETATIGALLARMTSRMPGSARIGSTLSHGFDGPMITPPRSRADHVARGGSGAGAIEAGGAHHRPALVAHEVLLKAEHARIGFQHCAHRIIAHGQDAGPHAKRCRLVRADLGQPLAGAQAPTAV